MELQALSKKDEQSLTGDALFVDAVSGNFALQGNSPAFKLGFKKLPSRFGVESAKMRRLARTPDVARWLMLDPATLRTKRRVEEMVWNGATLHNVTDLAEISALGAPGETGVVLTAVHGGSLAERAGLLVQDLLLAVNGKSVKNITALRDVSAAAGHEELQLDVLRQQKPIRLLLKPE